MVFPHQPLSVRYRGAGFNGPLAVPSSLLKRAHEEFDGRCLILGPCSRVGVEAQISPPIPHDAYSAAAYSAPGHAPSTPRGIAHLVGGQRLRLLRAKSERSWQLASVESFGELQPTAARRMRMDDEAERALELAVQGEAIGAFELALCTLDEVFDVFSLTRPISPICQSPFFPYLTFEFFFLEDRGGDLSGPEPCCPNLHPLWTEQQTPPTSAAELSYWLAARLPLTTALRAGVLSTCCPLQRLHTVIDAMRLLISADPKRFTHRLQLILETPSADHCSMALGGGAQKPRKVIGEVIARYSWTDQSSFPHA